MCGICGILDPERRLGSIGGMNAIQRHRGPDDEGYLFVNTRTGDSQVAGGDDTPADPPWPHHRSMPAGGFDLVLGSRRLAILDLSPAGRMPMSLRDHRFWVTYNGEVYNHTELRQTLAGRGHAFSTGTDTEVILAAYAEWGGDCLSRFNGMFAFAIWDAARRELFCARDRLGVKPFYYYWDGRTFVFASEIKALLLHPGVPRVADEDAIFDYLVRGVCDHSDKTFFSRIVSLPGGWALTLNTSSSDLTTRRWWRADINPELTDPAGGSEERVYGEFRSLLEDSIRLRLRSDVPVGTCLSGGLDSSAIVCLANGLLRDEQVIPRHLVGGHQKTFTARNHEEEIDEYRYSRLVVEKTGADQHFVFPEAQRLWHEVEAFAWHMDEPFSSTSQYPQWNVMRLAREHGVTVLLDGQGGDELLAGYHAYLPLYVRTIARERGMLAAVKSGWDASRVGGRPAFDTLYSDAVARLPHRLRRFLAAIRPPRTGPGTGGTGLTDQQLSPDFVARHRERLWQPPDVGADGLAGVLYRDMTSTNLPMLLRYEDRNSMAFSIEARVPFLDYRLVEFTFSLPLDFRIRQGWTKWVLRRSLQDVLPPAICWRRSKLGYPIPEKTWLAQGAGHVRRLLAPRNAPQVAQFVRPEVLAQLQHQGDDDVAGTPGVWRLTNLAIWFELFFNRPPGTRPALGTS